MSEQTVTATEATEHFAELLEQAERGESFVVMKDDRPVARIVPVETAHRQELTPEEKESRLAAHARLMEMIRNAGSYGGEKFDRDSLYADRLDRF